jgi:hypothetical protein
MSTSLEETVQQEQSEFEKAQIEKRRQNVEAPEPEPESEDDTDEEETPAASKPTGRSLFDPTQYETEPLSLPKVDGEGVDKISARFNGLVRLDRGQEADVAIIKNCKLGQTVTFMVECEVGPPVPGMTTNRDGDLDSLGLSRTFTVKHVYKPTAEEL